jgi:hypothetical protein
MAAPLTLLVDRPFFNKPPNFSVNPFRGCRIILVLVEICSGQEGQIASGATLGALFALTNLIFDNCSIENRVAVGDAYL